VEGVDPWDFSVFSVINTLMDVFIDGRVASWCLLNASILVFILTCYVEYKQPECRSHFYTINN
jgi:hypothetical protein